jgi:hypothetical protein
MAPLQGHRLVGLTPPDLLLPIVSEQIQRLRDAIEATGSARTLRRIVQLTAVCAGIAGNLHNDLGDPGRAADYFAIGRRAGIEAEDPALTAWEMTTESIACCTAAGRWKPPRSSTRPSRSSPTPALRGVAGQGLVVLPERHRTTDSSGAVAMPVRGA